ncbi:MAG: GNAT family N-acetyltransferase [Alphaproteobacteria bacterium]|nr:GNAT family N-acetyltransferase [Alphaproteobacteria bacterium]MCB9975382.1 GNAT family N-acetyltransferase [Rhodospirillales bacterium]
MDITLRKATIKDAKALTELELSAFDPAIYHRISGRQFRYLLTKANAETWVALCGKEICGYGTLLFRKNWDKAHFYSLAVSPAFQGKEIGKKLFEEVEAQARKKYPAMSLEIREDNKKLLERYLKSGYSEERLVPDYYPDRCACIKMKKIFL